MFIRITPAKGLVRLFAGIIVMAACCLRSPGSRAEQVTGTVRVVDGDTLAFEALDPAMTAGHSLFRLQGIDAPELAQRCLNRQGQPYPCGLVAKRKLQALLKGHTVTCRWQRVGRYGRPLVTCWILRRGRRVLLHDWMVRWGWALVYLSGEERLLSMQAKAQAKKRGLWQGLFRKPWRWRAVRRQ